jgi:hypothetical protein
MSSNQSDRANALYESDFYGWTELQANVLANRQVEALDWQNLREEVISLGKQEYRELVSRLTVLVGHLLKWEYQPDKRSRSWFLTIRDERSDGIYRAILVYPRYRRLYPMLSRPESIWLCGTRIYRYGLFPLTVFSPSRTSWPTISSAIPVRIGHRKFWV